MGQKTKLLKLRRLTVTALAGLLIFTPFFSYAQMDRALESSASKPAVQFEEPPSNFIPERPLTDRELATVIDELKDGLGKVIDFKGEARILRNPFEGWRRVQKGTIVRKGDEIRTGSGSFVDIAFDSYFLNMAHIEEDSKAVFQSIEPTRIEIKRGSIYNLVDGLRSGDRYRVSSSRSTFSAKGTYFRVGVEGKSITESTYSEKDKESVVEAMADYQQRLIPENSTITYHTGKGWGFQTRISEQEQEQAETILGRLLPYRTSRTRVLTQEDESFVRSRVVGNLAFEVTAAGSSFIHNLTLVTNNRDQRDQSEGASGPGPAAMSEAAADQFLDSALMGDTVPETNDGSNFSNTEVLTQINDFVREQTVLQHETGGMDQDSRAEIVSPASADLNDNPQIDANRTRPVITFIILPIDDPSRTGGTNNVSLDLNHGNQPNPPNYIPMAPLSEAFVAPPPQASPMPSEPIGLFIGGFGVGGGGGPSQNQVNQGQTPPIPPALPWVPPPPPSPLNKEGGEDPNLPIPPASVLSETDPASQAGIEV